MQVEAAQSAFVSPAMLDALAALPEDTVVLTPEQRREARRAKAQEIAQEGMRHAKLSDHLLGKAEGCDNRWLKGRYEQAGKALRSLAVALTDHANTVYRG